MNSGNWQKKFSENDANCSRNAEAAAGCKTAGVDESGSYRYGFAFCIFVFSGAKDR